MSISNMRRRFIQICSGVAIAVLACVSVLCFGIEKEKFSGPSKSSRSAKWRGVFLHDVELKPVDSDQKSDGIIPEEAWIESIYENYESFPIKRKSSVGIRLCVRFEYSPTGFMHSDTTLTDLKMAINEETPTPHGGVSNRSGITFDFPPDSQGTFPNEGELVFMNMADGTGAKFHYRIKRSSGVRE